MSKGGRGLRGLFRQAIVMWGVAGAVLSGSPLTAVAQSTTTAWSNGTFNVDTPNVVRRSNIMLQSPNLLAASSMPLGNGSMGAAVWAASGFTAQLNRDDTFPDRKSPGQVIIPGLGALTSAPNFTASLDLYNGVLVESGGGMTATIYVRATTDELVVDVTGADPSSTQTVQAYLWDPRSPTATASGNVATLAETWQDNELGATGTTFGSLLAITAGGRSITSSVVSPHTVQLQFNPNADGSFRVIVGAPTWTGGDAITTATSLFGSDATVSSATLEQSHLNWWHNYWSSNVLPLQMSSADGSARYLENLRTIYMYQEASVNRGTYPGNHAGNADLFNYAEDSIEWHASEYWFWNMRMHISANLSSGIAGLNTPYFNLYTNNLGNIEAFTAANVANSAGACVPEVMRYNGSGYGGSSLPDDGASCSSYIPPTWNGQTYSTGAEVSLWIWRQYLQTKNLAFLQAGYPLMKASAQFLLSQATLGSDGLLHTQANAHETQWFVTDPVTDILSMDALFPAVVSAAQILDTDQGFVSQLTTAEGEIPPLPRTDAATHQQVLTASADAAGNDVIAYSTEPYATLQNNENLDLQALWPYNVVSDTSSLLPLFIRTYNNRLWVNMGDWDDSPIQAARLGLASEVQNTLLQNILDYQVYPDGLANLWGWGGPAIQPYDEQLGIITTALNEALVQDYDGTLRIAPAWPSGWTASGVVAIQNNSKVDVQYENGTPVTVVLEAGATASQTVRSPWVGQSVEVIDATSSTTVVAPTTAPTFSVPMTAGHKYLIEQVSAPFTSLQVAQVTGTPASSPRQLTGIVTNNVGGPISPRPYTVGIGIPYGNLANAFNNVGVTADSNTNAGNLDGSGNSFSAGALAAAGVSPGTMSTVGGVTFVWPNTSGTGAPDNVVSNGQLISLNGSATISPTSPAFISATTLGFLLCSDYGATSGSGTITYTDGSTDPFTLPVPDWWDSSGADLAFNPTYLNSPGNTTTGQPVAIYFAGVTLDPTKGLASVSLPGVSAAAVAGVPALHIFSMGLQYANLASAFNNVGVTSDSSTSAGNYDGSGNSFSLTALQAAGVPVPQNPWDQVYVTVSGITLPWPIPAGTGGPDNVVAAGQVIAAYAQGSTLGFLFASDYGSATGTGTITYTDGSTSSFTLTAPDWWAGSSAGTVALAPTYLNGAANTSANQTVNIYYAGVPLNSNKTVATVQLPKVSTAAVAGSPALHIFSMALQ